MCSAERTQAEEERIRTLVNALPDAQRQQFYQQSLKRLKDPDTYATLNYIIVAGLHHFYLGKWQRGLFNLTVFAIGLSILTIDAFGIYIPLIDRHPLLLIWIRWQLGLGLLAGIILLELYALFKSQHIVQQYNNQVMKELYRELK